MTLYYTGVGSRETPPEMLETMRKLGAWLAKRGYVLRSGGADGADAAFEAGALDALGPRDIYLPWPGFNGHRSPLCRPSEDAFEMAATVHPAWDRLTRGPRALHARNCHQVLGDDLETPSKFVLCWTGDGCVGEASRTRATGGTATAIVVADRHEVPVVNLKLPDAKLALQAALGAPPQ